MKIPVFRLFLIKGAKLKFVRIHSPEQIRLAEGGGYPKECFMPPDEFFRRLRYSLPLFTTSNTFCAEFFRENINKIDPAEVLLAGHDEAIIIFRDHVYIPNVGCAGGAIKYETVRVYLKEGVLVGYCTHSPVYADHSIHDPFYPFYIVGYVE